MTLKISNNRKLEELQNDFNQRFPFLKIEFFSKNHDKGERSLSENMLNNKLAVGEIREKMNIGFLPLDGGMKVGDFEHMAQTMFNLNIQVYRLSYGEWLQTWATDIWTLDEQNHRGEIMENIKTQNHENI